MGMDISQLSEEDEAGNEAGESKMYSRLRT